MKVRYLLTEVGQLVSCSDVLDDLSVEDVRIGEVRAGLSVLRQLIHQIPDEII
jgi:hypothetical protein